MVERKGWFAGVKVAGWVGIALGGLVLGSPAIAQNLTIDGDRTTPVLTSEAAGGDVTVTGSGSVIVEDDGPVITINSDSDVTVEEEGDIVNTAVSDALGVYIDLENSRAANFVLEGNLSVGELDATLPIGTNNVGILVGTAGQPGVLTGNIALGDLAFLVVAGDDSIGVEVNSRVVGDLTFNGSSTVTGSGAVGVVIRNIVNGELTFRGTMVARGTGTPSATALDDISSSAVQIGASIIDVDDGDPETKTIGGFYVDGPVEITDTTFPSQIRAVGGLPAVHISPIFAGENAALIEFGFYSSLGTTEDPDPANALYSFVNRGIIQSDGLEPGRDVEGMRVEGYHDGVTLHEVEFLGALFNAGTIGGIATSSNTQATDVPAAEAHAVGLVIGAGATIPSLVNDGSVSASTSGTAGGTATALLIEEGGNLSSVVNLVSISGRSATTDGTIDNVEAIAIRDLSNTLTSIDNSGTIEALVTDTESGSTAIAIDVSASTNSVAIDNVNEEDATLAAIIRGEVRFGTGNANVLNIDGRLVGEDEDENEIITARALVAGMVSVADGGSADINVIDGTLQTRSTSVTNITAGRAANDPDFDSDDLPTVELVLDSTPNVDPILSTTGTMTFYENSLVTFSSFAFLGDGGAYSLLNAEGGIDFKDQAASLSFDAPFLYHHEFALSDDLQALDLVLQRKTAAELGLTGNLAAVYEPAVTAAALDNLFGRGLVFITDAAGVTEAMNSLVPNIGIGARALTIAVTDTISGPIGQRQRDLNAAPADGLRFWGQQFYEDMNGATTTRSPSFFGSGAGVSVGLDWGQNNTRYGLSYTYFAGQVTESIPRATKTNIALNLASLYANWRANNFFVMPQVSFGYASYDNRRRVVAGPITRNAISDWSAYLTSGGITTGYVMNLGAFELIPHVSVDGLYMTEGGYIERHAGDGVNLSLGTRETRSVRLFAGIAAQTEFMLEDGLMKPHVLAGWSHELLDDRRVIDASFEAIPGTDFAVVGPKADASKLIGGAGFSYLFDNWSAAFNYDAAQNSGAFSQSASVTMTSRF